MKKLTFIMVILFISIKIFSQNCSRETRELDEMEPINAAKESGWVFWPETSDEFNDSTLDRSKWDVSGQDSGFYCHGMSPYAYFKDDTSVVRLQNGRLILKCKPDSTIICDSNEYHYSSGYILSKEASSGGPLFHFGLIQLKCKFPNEVGLEPCFWTTGGVWPGNYMTRYDEIDVIEKIMQLGSNKTFRQSLVRWIFPEDTDTIKTTQVECRQLLYPTPYTGIEFIITLEWLPTEINFYMNGHWTNTYKYTTDPSAISPIYYQGTRSNFTCVDFTYACKQGIQLSLSLTDPNPVDLTKGFEVDWIRSYKLVQGVETYWPTNVSLADPELTRVHNTVKFGGALHNGTIPANCTINVWASNSIILDKGFTLQPNCTFELRRIDTHEDLLVSPVN